MRHKLLSIVLLMVTACSDNEQRPELIDSVRGVGASASPQIISFSKSSSTQVKVSFLVLLPKDLTVTNTAVFDDVNNKLSVLGELSLDSKQSEQLLGALKLVTITGTLTLPKISVQQLSYANDVLKVRYGVTVNGSDGSQEYMVSDVLVVTDNNPALEWKPPTINITKPLATDTLSTANSIDISADINKLTFEPLKIAWYVSSGKIKNRRAYKTEWSEMGAGEQGLVAAIHGTRSGFVAWDVETVKFE